MPHDGSSPTSFGETAADPIEALRLLAAQEHLSPGFRLALKREIAFHDDAARRASRSAGVCLSGMGGEPRQLATLDAIKAEGDRFDADLAAYRASPEGKARRVIAKACAECAERNLPRIYRAFEAVAQSLSRGDADPQIWVDRLQGTLAAIDDQDVSDLQVMATELRVYVSQIGGA